MRYQANEAVLHTDASLMPRRRRAWASWNYHLADERRGRTAVTYWMNNLQHLDAERDYFVTLNRSERIARESVIETIAYDHPVITHASVAAQVALGRDQRRRPDPLLRRLLALGLPRGRLLERAACLRAPPRDGSAAHVELELAA